ncbi:hypothetical protein [Sphingomonas sp.]|uniref:hypothetical protein n=1 Tax=Sphingomonas sp. TaxID=28214 RepID=UPI00307F089C
MPRQSLYFLTEYADRVEAHVIEAGPGLAIELLYHPPSEPETLPCDDIDAAADLLEQRVLRHFGEYGTRLNRILMDGEQGPFGIFSLGRFGVPLLPAG